MLRQTITAVGAVLLLAACAMANQAQWIETMPDPGGPSMEAGQSYLGVDVQDVASDRVAALKLKAERGAEITMVDQDAPAGKAGLKEHDVILTFNGQPLESVEQLRRLIHEEPAGRTVTLGISRDGQPMQIAVQLADRKKAMAHMHENGVMPNLPHVIAIPPMPAIDVTVHTGPSVCGLVVDNLTPQLGEFFGVKNGEGVLVRSVEKGSPADAAGFHAGDVIVRVDDHKIADRGDWRSALRQHPGGKINVGIVREKHEQTLSVTLPPAKADQSSLDIELPDIDQEMQELEVALNQMRPELMRVTRDAVKQTRDVVKQNRKQLKQASKEIQKAMEKAGPELDRQLKEFDKELEEAQHELDAEISTL
jgi:predicted metalloprotease with PDZ domain